MPIPIIPIAAVAVFGALLAAKPRGAPVVSKQVEAQRRYIYNDAMTAKDMTPERLRKLAIQYQAQGMPAEADMLIRRAVLRETNAANPKLREARADALRKAFASTNVDAIRHMANVHQEMGALGAAAGLRELAAGLEAKQNEVPERLPTHDDGTSQ